MTATTTSPGQPGLVYLIHLESPLAHARHYTGWTKDSWNLRLRIAHHRAGYGARMLAAASKAGIRFHVVRVVDGTRHDERRLKRGKNVARLCPVCTGRRVICCGCGRLYRHAGWLRRHQLTKNCR